MQLHNLQAKAATAMRLRKTITPSVVSTTTKHPNKFTSPEVICI
jgi:hypothetical protein